MCAYSLGTREVRAYVPTGGASARCVERECKKRRQEGVDAKEAELKKQTDVVAVLV